MKPVNKIESQERYKVSGKTTIIHNIRVRLKLSAEEYIVMDFVSNWNENNSENILFKDYFRETGYAPDDVHQFMQHMKNRGLLVWDEKKKRVDVNQEWKDIFSTKDLCSELWKILPKGNKATAKERLPKVLKKISFEELKEKLIAYKKHCEVNNIFIKGLDTWLNVKKEHWNDPLVGNTKNKDTAPKSNTKVNFIK